jgi:hypothetical protein
MRLAILGGLNIAVPEQQHVILEHSYQYHRDEY